jgi:alpha-glucosidase
MASLCSLDMMHRKLTSLAGIFPGRGSVIWRDWYTHDVVNATPGANTTLPAPLGHINVHLRDGSAILLHAQPAYTIEETRQGPFSLLVSQGADGKAFGTAFIDDGISNPPGPSKTLSFVGSKGQLQIRAKGTFDIKQTLQDITILGVNRPTTVTLQGETVKKWAYFEAQQKLVISGVNGDLNEPVSLSWK